MDREVVNEHYYFDVTDIVDYAKVHSRVSGIQRVVINVVRDACVKMGADRVRCILYHRMENRIVVCNPMDLFVERDFSAELMLFRLGMRGRPGLLPAKVRLKAYLRSFGKKKLLRAAKKLEVILSSLLFPSRLEKLGLQRSCDLYPGAKLISLAPVEMLTHEDVLVRLGSNWYPSPMDTFTQRHGDNGGKVMTMVYDLIPLNCPQYVTSDLAQVFAEWLGRAIRQTTHFMCISRFTASELCEFMRLQGATLPTIVTPLAHEFPGIERNVCVAASSQRLGALSTQSYVLCVGTMEIRKNGISLLRAWLRLQAELGDSVPVLVFAGRRGWLLDEFDALLDANPVLHQMVKFIDTPSDQELAYLYSNCMFTVFPSLYEGWGLPIGEAAWFGKYCIASSASSMPEVCGELADYIDPTNLEDLIIKIRRAVIDPAYVHQREISIRSAPLRSWNDVTGDICGQLLRARGLSPSDGDSSLGGCEVTMRVSA